MFVGERMLGEHAGRYEHLAMGAIVIGVLGAALCAPPRSTTRSAEELTITLVLIGLGAREPAALPAARARATRAPTSR